MNGIGVRGGVPPEVREAQIARLAEFLKGDHGLREWRPPRVSPSGGQVRPARRRGTEGLAGGMAAGHGGVQGCLRPAAR